MSDKTLLVQLNNSLKIFYSKYPDVKVKTVINYDDMFIFDMNPINNPLNDVYIIPLMSINKIDGEIRAFNPLKYDRQKYLDALTKAIKI